MMKKKFLAAALGALMVSGSALAADVDVRVSPTGVGDLLWAPAYMIGGGWQTKLKVVNTDLTNSVVAKVIVRDNIRSEERIDWFVYLSPGDVWEGTLRCLEADANGQCTRSVVESDDDSVLVYQSNTQWASTATPAAYPGGTGTHRAAMANLGYVEIVGLRAFPGTPGTSKAAVKAAYDALPVGTLSITADQTVNSLTGTATISNPLNGLSTSLPLFAVENYDNALVSRVGADVTLGAPNAATSTAALERALWRTSFAVPYEVTGGAGTMFSLTFPTKQTYLGRATNGQYTFGSTVCITANVFDMSENTIQGSVFNVSPLPPAASTCVPEQAWLTMGTQVNTGTFAKGWAQVGFQTTHNQAEATTGQLGAPAISSVVNIRGAQIDWMYAAGR
jgi:hypothetical protein